MTFAEQTKEELLKIIEEMAQHPEKYCKNPGVDFTRSRKLDFENLLQLLVSMEAGTVRDELLKYFQYDDQTATNSAFFQQRAKLSDEALPFMFHCFNAKYPYTLYRNKYHLLASDGSSFTFTEIQMIPIRTLLRMVRLQTDTTKSISSRSMISFPKDIPIASSNQYERKMNFKHYAH